MEAFYIIKPDMIVRNNVMDYYNCVIDNLLYIENRRRYIISDWVDLSCMLYEPSDREMSIDKLKKIRSQMLTTIKGYDYLYKDGEAYIDIFDIPDDINILKELEEIKYNIRRRYVLNTPKNYFKFNSNMDELVCYELKDIPVRELDVSHMRVNYDEDIDNLDYRLAFLNCIHFPDSDYLSVSRDLDVIDRSKLLTKKIQI
jgi:hypothetical protein